MEKTKKEILDLIKINKDEIEKFGVKKLGLFGSAVHGEMTKNSDLDFLVEFEKKSFDSYMDLKFLLEELFNCKVDLVLRDAIKARLKNPILKEAVYAEGF